MMANYNMIEAAAVRLAGMARNTPLLHSPLLDLIAGRRVYVKAECLQVTGSFKFRGAWSAISALSEERRRHGVIAYSAGNHGQGVALAAKMHGIPALVVMPSDAPRIKLENTRAYGAEVVTYDRKTESREDIGQRLSANRGLTLIKPFDDPQVIAGQGTVGLELAKQLKNENVGPCDVLVPCGGGGLTAGIALALEKAAPGFVVRTCEPENYDDTARSLASGKRVANEGNAPFICDAIVTPIPGELTFPIIQRLCGEGLVVTDDQVREAMGHALNHLKLVIEPGGAAALAAALFQRQKFDRDSVVVIASGGNVDLPFLADIARRP
jgi:threonine dehydratase